MCKKAVLVTLIALMILFTGCRKEDVGSRIIVRQIQVSMPQGFGIVHKAFTTDVVMQHILGAIRMLGQEYRPSADPDKLAVPTVRIEITHTDGSTHTILTKADRYIRRDSGPWQEVDTENLARLHNLLQQLPIQA